MAERSRSVEDFFAGAPVALAIYRRIDGVAARLGAREVRVTTSQIALRAGRAFAYVWRPGQYLRSDVPAVLSIPLPRQVESHRFKEVAHPAATVWMHHLELHAPREVDDEVAAWLAEAYRHASRDG